jgi:hypothetical protein
MKKKTNLYEFFIGEHVEIVTKNVMVDSSGGAGPLTFRGYLLDQDEALLALGSSPLEIDTVIKKDDISAIQIQEVKDVYEELLEEMDVSNEKGN